MKLTKTKFLYGEILFLTFLNLFFLSMGEFQLNFIGNIFYFILKVTNKLIFSFFSLAILSPLIIFQTKINFYEILILLCLTHIFFYLIVKNNMELQYKKIPLISYFVFMFGSFVFFISLYISFEYGYKNYISYLYVNNKEALILNALSKHIEIFYIFMSFLSYIWLILSIFLYEQHKEKKVYKTVNIKSNNSNVINYKYINILFASLSFICLVPFLTDGQNGFFTLSKSVESIVQVLYHSTFIFFLLVAIFKKFNFLMFFLSLFLGYILFYFEIIDVLLFEYFYELGLFPATNPLSLKLMLQFISVFLIVFVYLNGHRSFTIIFSIFSGFGILFVMLLYHSVFINTIIKPTQEYNLDYLYEQIIENDNLSYLCGRDRYICLQDKNNGIIKTLSYYINENEYATGYDPLIINSFRVGKKGEKPSELKFKKGFSQNYQEFEKIIVEWDASFIYYKGTENQILLIDIYNYIYFFRGSLFAFYFISIVMLYFWFFGLIKINNIHQQKFGEKNV